MKIITPEELIEQINDCVFWDATTYPEGVAEKIVLTKILKAKVQWENEAILRSMDENLEDIL